MAAATVTVDDLLAQEQISPALADSLRAYLTTRARRYRDRIAMMAQAEDGGISWSPGYEQLLRWRDSGRLPDDSLRILRRELDHEERTLPDR